MAPLFGPRQLGVGIQGAARQPSTLLATTFKVWLLTILWLNSILPTCSAVCIGLTCCCQLETAYPSCLSSYSQPSFFYFGSHVILSPEGPQQGDPLGPLLFCSTIHPLFTSLSSNLTLGYLDDLTLAGPQSAVAADIQQVIAEGSKMGLRLNPSKCEVISCPDPNIIDQTMSSFTFVTVADATLLGAPLFPGKVLDDTWLARCEELKRAVDRLSLLSA